jgi:hypothetical protein
MALQASQVNRTYPFILGGTALVKENETLLQDASRTVILDQYTVMAQVAASRKWVPWTTVTATDGSAVPAGILMNDGGISAAALAADDVTGAVILVGTNVEVDAGQLVFDKGSTGQGTALALTTVFTGNAAGTGSATPYILLVAERLLNMIGIYPKTAFVAAKAEN